VVVVVSTHPTLLRCVGSGAVGSGDTERRTPAAEEGSALGGLGPEGLRGEGCVYVCAREEVC